MYYLYSENKGADLLCSYREADLCLCLAYAKSQFCHNAAHLVKLGFTGVYIFLMFRI